MGPARKVIIPAFLAALAAGVPAQTQVAPEMQPLNSSGFVDHGGHKSAYLIRHLPISSFPDLPAAIQAELTRRGCLIPQTYQAHHPENVVGGSFEKAGSRDWAALCSANGTVSLLVFFASAPGKPTVLATAAETRHLSAQNRSGILGFNWGLDTASPEQVHEAQAAMESRPPLLDHDSIAESTLDQPQFFHFYSHGSWRLVDTGN